MTAALVLLALVLTVLLFAALVVSVYEILALRNKADDISTISTYWTRFHRGRVEFMVILGLLLSVLYVFLMGDLVLEWW